jgi:hypothetical protein
MVALSFISTIIAVLALVVAFRSHQNSKRGVQTAVRMHSRAAITESLLANFSRCPISIRDQQSRVICTLLFGDIRSRAWRWSNSVSPEPITEWRRLAGNGRGQFPHSVEHQLAYQFSGALQDLGYQLFTDAGDLRQALTVFAPVFVETWLLAEAAVGEIRQHEGLVQEQDGVIVDFHRRHGEWLGLVAVLWIREHWRKKDGSYDRWINRTSHEIQDRVAATMTHQDLTVLGDEAAAVLCDLGVLVRRGDSAC